MEIASGVEIVVPRVDEASIAETVAIPVVPLIADDPLTAAVGRDVIATGRERTEWTLPPGRWLG